MSKQIWCDRFSPLLLRFLAVLCRSSYGPISASIQIGKVLTGLRDEFVRLDERVAGYDAKIKGLMLP